MARNRKPAILTEEHHRRARSLGGTDKPENISFVQSDKHKNWHTLFGNMNAFQICDRINTLLQKPPNVIVICRFINGSEVKRGGGKNNSKNEAKIAEAWKGLFKGSTFRAAINYINSTWLDPSYHLYIERLKLKKRK